MAEIFKQTADQDGDRLFAPNATLGMKRNYHSHDDDDNDDECFAA